MGIAVYLVLEEEIAGVDPLSVDGKMLAQVQDRLDQITEGAGLKTIAEMTSFSDDELDGFFEEDEARPANEEQWFAAADGLATVRALLQQLQVAPDLVPRSKDVIEDLLTIETVLVAADAQQLRFHFALDF
ncbi:MAG TPA: hypothetical protein VFZ34_06250 [Blastocatellia bacterium]|nr:hypothetical protein [Blastocatellia bacterium]